MATIERSIDVQQPVRTAYDQWTQFELFPSFLRHVLGVRQIDERRQVWRVTFGGQVREFEAEIVEQIPDKRIAWRSVRGAHHRGVVTFHRLEDAKCRLMLQLEYEPKGLLERIGGWSGVVRTGIVCDLRRFVAHVEGLPISTGGSTGGWRGRILNKDDAREAGEASWRQGTAAVIQAAANEASDSKANEFVLGGEG